MALSRLTVAVFLGFALPVLAGSPVSVDHVSVDTTRDRLADVLGVQQVTATVRSRKPFRKAGVVLTWYRNGEKVKTSQASNVERSEPQHSAEITLQSADLDRLQLGKPKPGFTRVFCKLSVQGDSFPMFASATVDIDKATCDLGMVNGGGKFSDHTVQDGSVPLFYQLRSRSRTVSGGRSTAELLKRNPDADILIVSIALED